MEVLNFAQQLNHEARALILPCREKKAVAWREVLTICKQLMDITPVLRTGCVVFMVLPPNICPTMWAGTGILQKELTKMIPILL